MDFHWKWTMDFKALSSLPCPHLSASLETFLEQQLFFIWISRCSSPYDVPYLLYPGHTTLSLPSLTHFLLPPWHHREDIRQQKKSQKMNTRCINSLLVKKSHHKWDMESDRCSTRKKGTFTRRTKSHLDLTSEDKQLLLSHVFCQTPSS